MAKERTIKPFLQNWKASTEMQRYSTISVKNRKGYLQRINHFLEESFGDSVVLSYIKMVSSNKS